MAGGTRGASAITIIRGGASGACGGQAVIGGNVSSCGNMFVLTGRVLTWPDELEDVPSPIRGSSLSA